MTTPPDRRRYRVRVACGETGCKLEDGLIEATPSEATAELLRRCERYYPNDVRGSLIPA